MKKFLKKYKVDPEQTLEKQIHYRYALWTIHQLGQYIIHFQNAQPWVHYYVVHTINILGKTLEPTDSDKMIKALKYCFN